MNFPCLCRKCLRDRDSLLDLTRMIVCRECGDKRCPHADDHANACTGAPKTTIRPLFLVSSLCQPGEIFMGSIAQDPVTGAPRVVDAVRLTNVGPAEGIKRYDPFDHIEHGACMQEDPEGDWVSWSDHRARVKELEAERDRYMRALVHIRANSESQLHAQAFAGIAEDDPAYINARWNYTEANTALGQQEAP